MEKEKTKVLVSHILEYEGCGESIELGDPCYAVQSGYVDEIGEFVREDSQSQLFHIKCI